MRTREGRAIIYLLVAAAVAVAVVALFSYRQKSRGSMPASAAQTDVPPRRTLPPLPARSLSPRLKSLRARAMEAAARERGLGWRGEVGMTELTGWEYGTRTREIADVLATDDLKGLSRLAVAGGMLPEGTDVASLAVSFTAATAGATYSPLDKQVLLVSESPKGGQARDAGLLTHEFVHALQDQHFDLLKMMTARPYNFDRTEALFALVEGDAMSVERRTQQGEAWKRRTLEEIARSEDERFTPYRRGIGALFPPLLTETFIFRYRDGVRFVEAVRRARPDASVDEVFRRPPASSEQVLHPEKYLAGEAPREVHIDGQGFADDGWRLSAMTPLGEVGARGLLLAGVEADEARRAAAGWGGDRAWLFERPNGAPLFVWKTAWDTGRDAQEFFRAYNALLARRGAAKAPESAGDSERGWREGGLLTLVRLEGEAVIVVRGAAADVPAAMGLARKH